MTIEFSAVTKRYPDGTTAVDALDLTIETGSFTVFVGPSGCGKTTSMRMINRMITPSSGSITLDGRDIQTIDAVRLRRGIGYVIQHGGLFPHHTVERNVATVPLLLGTSRREAIARARELLELVGLDPALGRRYPSQLSGGQQQRVGVARALAADPPVMLMGEPFSAVDPVVREQLQDEFLRLQRELGTTIVLAGTAVATLFEWLREHKHRRRAAIKSRQGVRYHMQEAITVLDPVTMEPVPADGETMGEIMFRGNIVMKGYLKNPEATAEAFAGGWFHSGDLVRRDDEGFIYVVDRAKDMIISGGENIYCAEVENVLFGHPSITEAAIIGRAHEKWGEVPVAVVVLAPGADDLTLSELEPYLNENLARYKHPKDVVVVSELPRNASGKVLKHVLRKERVTA